jgi:EF hand
LAIKYLVGSYQESPKRAPRRQYSKMVEERLDVARRLFRKFDKDGSGSITEEEVIRISIEGCSVAGRDLQEHGRGLLPHSGGREVVDEDD